MSSYLVDKSINLSVQAVADEMNAFRGFWRFLLIFRKLQVMLTGQQIPYLWNPEFLYPVTPSESPLFAFCTSFHIDVHSVRFIVIFSS